MNSIWIAILVGAACGVLSALGVGGGSLLMVWLSVILALPQQQAQGVNLLYFLPTAATGLLFHMKNKMIRWEIVLPAVVLGCVAAAGGAWLAQQIELTWLRKGFGVFLLLAGLLELKKTRQTPKSDA